MLSMLGYDKGGKLRLRSCENSEQDTESMMSGFRVQRLR
jgi:hypothetical protein